MLTHLTKELWLGLSQDEIDEVVETGQHMGSIENGGSVRLIASQLVSGLVDVDQVLEDREFVNKLTALRDIGVFAIITEFPDVELHADLDKLRNISSDGRNFILPESAIFGSPNDTSKKYQKITLYC